jgi:hypothetical protein
MVVQLNKKNHGIGRSAGCPFLIGLTLPPVGAAFCMGLDMQHLLKTHQFNSKSVSHKKGSGGHIFPEGSKSLWKT